MTMRGPKRPRLINPELMTMVRQVARDECCSAHDAVEMLLNWGLVARAGYIQAREQTEADSASLPQAESAEEALAMVGEDDDGDDE